MSRWVTLVEIELDNQTLRLAPVGEATPAGFYEEMLVGLSSIEREVPVLPGSFRSAQLTISVTNVTGVMSIAKASPMRNRRVRVLFGERAAGAAGLATVFTGAIERVEITPTEARLIVRDTAADILAGALPRIGYSMFPMLPGTTPRHVLPVVFGDVSSDDYRRTGDTLPGPVPCYLIDTSSDYVYMVAAHKCKAVDAVYRYGVLVASGYTVTTAAYGGRTVTVIKFSTDQRDSGRPNEEEISADVRGVVDESDALVTNPVLQLRWYLENICGLTSETIDADAFSAAAAVADDEGYAGAAWVGGDSATRESVIDAFASSFCMPIYLTREGRIGVRLISPTYLLDEYSPAELTDVADILRGTFSMQSNTDVASTLRYRCLYDAATSDYRAIYEQTAVDEDQKLGMEVLIEKDMPYVRDATTAHKVAAARLLLMNEARLQSQFSLPPDRIGLDLMDWVAVTHRAGVDSGGGGWNRRQHIVSGIRIDISPTAALVEVRATAAGGAEEHADSHCDDHTDATLNQDHQDSAHTDSHSDSAHSDSPHSDQHTDIHYDEHGDHTDGTPHQDSHTDSHVDTHSDGAHGDVPHSDQHWDTHNDWHDDAAHSDSPHEDTPHYDSYYDSHIDEHGDSYEGEHLDTYSDQHVDYYDDEHTDVAHGDSHGDSHADGHSDVHDDVAHVDSSHTDAYTDVHEDVAHSDHTDTSHTDTAHTDTHYDEHTDVAHGDGHGDSHADTAHADVPHQDGHGDTPHMDFHCDSDIEHADSHTDTPHSDVAHGDVAHSDHNDTHNDATQFGYTTVGSSEHQVGDGTQITLAPKGSTYIATYFTCPGNTGDTVTLTGLYAYFYLQTGSNSQARLALYKESDKSLVCQGSSALTISGTPGWQGHTSFSGSTSLTPGTKYLVVVTCSAQSGEAIRFKYNSGSNGDTGYVGVNYLSGFPGTLPSLYDMSYRFSMKANVTVSGSTHGDTPHSDTQHSDVAHGDIHSDQGLYG